MYLIGQIWWLLSVAFVIGALAGYCSWRACQRPRMEARYLRDRRELEDRIAALEQEMAAKANATIATNGSTTSSPAAPRERPAESLELPSIGEPNDSKPAPSPPSLNEFSPTGTSDAPRSPADGDPQQTPDSKKPDNLKLIRGIGPRLEKMLNAIGVYNFDQIANWTDQDIALVDKQLRDFSGRAVRDKWVEQSRHLLAGGRSTKSGEYSH